MKSYEFGIWVFMLAAFLGSIALVVAIGARPVARRLTRRLERLQHGVESLGAGDLGARVKVEGRDEVARLAQSFNQAATRIESLVEEISMKRLLDGQFDSCGLTLQELAAIKDSLIKSVTAVYHGRVKYPDQRTA